MQGGDCGRVGSGRTNDRRSSKLATECLSDSSVNDNDLPDEPPSPPAVAERPTTFQDRVASAGTRRTPQPPRQGSVETLDPHKLANMLGARTKLCDLVPDGLDTRTSSDACSDDELTASTARKLRTTKVKRRAHKTSAPPADGVSDEDGPRKREEKKSKKKSKTDTDDRLHSGRDNERKKTVPKTGDSSKKVKSDERMSKQDRAAGELSKKTKTRTVRDDDDLPIFELGEFPAAKKGAERSHKSRRQEVTETERKLRTSGRQKPGNRLDSKKPGDDVGNRKTLKTEALVKGNKQFAKLKQPGATASLPPSAWRDGLPDNCYIGNYSYI